jgi:MFS family permease
VPPYAFAFLTTISIAILSEKLGQRAMFIGGSSLFGAIGYCILLGNNNPSARPGVSYLGVFFAAGGIYPAVALVLSWPAINVSGQTKRAIANAMQISIGNCGAVIGTQLYRSTDGPRYIVGHSVALAYLVANAAVVTVLYFRLKRENKRREAIAPEIKDVGIVTDWRGDSDPRWRYEY